MPYDELKSSHSLVIADVFHILNLEKMSTGHIPAEFFNFQDLEVVQKAFAGLLKIENSDRFIDLR